jgi:hypothetical protein
MAAVAHDRERHYFAEVDGGRLFIADGKYFQKRSINCYNNFFTQFFARLFGVSFEATLNGKTYVLNRKSYAKFIEEHGCLTLDRDTQENYRNINRLPLIDNASGLMRHAISPWKAKTLAEKLFKAMAANHQNNKLLEIEDLIGRGADIDSYAWYREDTGHFIFTDLIGNALSNREHSPFRAVHYTPLIMAALKARLTGEWHVYNHLLAYEANPQLKGEACTFARHHVGTQNYMIPRVVMRTKIYGHGYGQNARHHIQHEPGLVLVTRQTHRFVDHYYDRAELSLWPDANVTQQPLNPVALPFEKTYTTGRLPILV